MNVVIVFWYTAYGWFNPTILGPFSEEDFARWSCSMGHFVEFPVQKLLLPVSAVEPLLLGLKGKKKDVKLLLRSPALLSSPAVAPLTPPQPVTLQTILEAERENRSPPQWGPSRVLYRSISGTIFGQADLLAH